MVVRCCKTCNVKFWSDRQNKLYCSKSCYFLIRKLKHNDRSVKRYRLEHGTYNKWIVELRALGYIVIPPASMVLKSDA